MADIKTQGKLASFLWYLYEDDLDNEDSHVASPSSKLSGDIESMIAKSEFASKRSWLKSAQKQQKTMERRFEEFVANLRKNLGSYNRLASKMRKGELDASVQDLAIAHFRDEDMDQVSDEDIASCLEDCLFLETDSFDDSD